MTGNNVDIYPRYNFSVWYDGADGTDMADMPKVRGCAVFIYSASKKRMTHVGYLEKPVNGSKPNGDWYIIEAKGVRQGVARTKLSARSWNRWELMVKHFAHVNRYNPIEYILGGRTLKYGCTGTDVKQLQEALIDLGLFLRQQWYR